MNNIRQVSKADRALGRQTKAAKLLGINAYGDVAVKDASVKKGEVSKWKQYGFGLGKFLYNVFIRPFVFIVKFTFSRTFHKDFITKIRAR